MAASARGQSSTAVSGDQVLALPVAGAIALLSAVPAVATGPECADVAVSTRVCTRGPGHVAITTSPDPAYTNPYPAWGFGTLGTPAIGIGGGGIWIGL